MREPQRDSETISIPDITEAVIRQYGTFLRDPR
jgi:hypothetical protein